MGELIGLKKVATGIAGLDELTGGGLPRGRATLVCGEAGCGKSLLALEFLVRGATQYAEPGVLMAFEETAEELAENVASLGFDLPRLTREGLLWIEHVAIERSELEEAGEYDLEGLFLRLGRAIDAIGAKRVAIDTIEVLFSTFSNSAVLRSELRRLHRWLKQRGVSSIITGESDDGTHTRHGLDEYVSDCVIVLGHRVVDELSTRTLRVLKYRGTKHGTNEYPFLIDDHGLSVMPITSLGLGFKVSTERVASGIDRLDTMLNGGPFLGSSVLISGTAGTGKTSIASHYADTCCRQGKRCAFFSFEEAPAQVVRNMRSIGIDLTPWTEQGTLRFISTRPTQRSLEAHLVTLHRVIDQFRPSMVVIDPITSFAHSGRTHAIQSMLLRLVDYIKSLQITAIFTSLTSASHAPEATDEGISSLIDTWILLQMLEGSGERNRGLYVLKSRGMAHSNQIREFLITEQGLALVDVVTGPSGFVTGAARLARQALDKAQLLAQRQELEARSRDFERRREAHEARLQALRAEFAVELEEHLRDVRNAAEREESLALDRRHQLEARFGDDSTPAHGSPASGQGESPCSARGTGGRESWTRSL